MVRLRDIDNRTPLQRLEALRNDIPEGAEPAAAEAWANYVDESIEREKRKAAEGRTHG